MRWKTVEINKNNVTSLIFLIIFWSLVFVKKKNSCDSIWQIVWFFFLFFFGKLARKFDGDSFEKNWRNLRENLLKRKNWKCLLFIYDDIQEIMILPFIGSFCRKVREIMKRKSRKFQQKKLKFLIFLFEKF